MLENFTLEIVQFMEDIANSISSWFSDHLLNIIIILIGAAIVRHFGGKLVHRLLHHTIREDLYPTKADRDKRVKTIDSLVTAVVRVAVFIGAVMLIIGEINPGYTAALFASAGLITVALGFGAQSLVKDFVSGMFIITENQYRVGDTVEIAGVSGVVEEVTIRSTILRDLEGNIHHVPNGLIQVTTNKTMGYSRLNEQLVVAAGTDLDKLEAVINAVGIKLAKEPSLEQKIIDAPHFGSLKGYAPNGGVIVSIVGKTMPAHKWRVKSELYRLLHKELDKAKIEVTSLPPVPPALKKK